MAELREGLRRRIRQELLTAMIAHHEGASVMVEDELREGQSPDALLLAQDIIDVQETEVQQMQQLLQDN